MTTDLTVAESLQALDVAWVDDALRTAGHSSGAVIDVKVEPVAFSGATTDMARVRLSYDEPGTGPATAIAKIRGVTEVQRRMDGAIGLFEREARFYRTLAAQVPVASPTCYVVGDGDRTPLLLQDLADLRMGDQMDGLALDDAESLMGGLAELHAAFWGSEAVDADWLLRHDKGLYPQLVTQLVSSGARALRGRYPAEEVPEQIVEQVNAWAPRWAELLRIAAEGPATLVHNDCRLDNVFFARDGSPVLLDWQVISRTRGTQDVANLLAGSMTAPDLAEHWERLLRLWHDRLTAAGVSGYSFDQAVTHYRQNVFFPLGAGLALIGAMNIGDGRGLGDAIITRCLRHITDVDAFAALEGR